jgi:hypothetical protein
MPVGIISQGGQNWKADLASSQDDAIKALKDIQVHLSQPGGLIGNEYVLSELQNIRAGRYGEPKNRFFDKQRLKRTNNLTLGRIA